MERYSVSLRIQSEYRKIRARNDSVFGHFSRSDGYTYIYIYHCSENGVVWLLRSFLNLYTWLTISSCYGPFDLGLIGRDGGLSTQCHSRGFACQQSVLKTFPGSGSLRSDDTSITSNNIASNAPRYFWNQFSIDLEKFCYSVFLFNVSKQLFTFSVAFGSRISDRLQYHSLTRSAQKTNVFATDERRICSFKKNWSKIQLNNCFVAFRFIFMEKNLWKILFFVLRFFTRPEQRIYSFAKNGP